MVALTALVVTELGRKQQTLCPAKPFCSREGPQHLTSRSSWGTLGACPGSPSPHHTLTGKSLWKLQPTANLTPFQQPLALSPGALPQGCYPGQHHRGTSILWVLTQADAICGPLWLPKCQVSGESQVAFLVGVLHPPQEPRTLLVVQGSCGLCPTGSVSLPCSFSEPHMQMVLQIPGPSTQRPLLDPEHEEEWTPAAWLP